MTDLLVLLLLSTLGVAACLAAPGPRVAGWGLALRFGGAVAYLLVMNAVYGSGDYVLYDTSGRLYARWIAEGEWHHVVNPRNWYGDFWWATQAVIYLTAAILTVVEVSTQTLFLLFAFLSFLGATLFWRAAAEALDARAALGYGWLVMTFPSLVFWPSALGKDALVLLGLGVAVWGAQQPRARLAAWIAGLALVLLIRPQVAAVATAALVFGRAFGPGVWTLRRAGETLLMVAALVLVLRLGEALLGFSLTDLAEIEAYLDERVNVSAYGGSALARDAGGVSPLVGLFTFFFEPLPWRIGNGLQAIAAVETYAVLALVAWRWRSIVAALARPETRRLAVTSVTFILLYGTLLGMAAGNIGTLVRQKLHVLPFLFFLVAVAPGAVSRVRDAASLLVARRRAWTTAAP